MKIIDIVRTCIICFQMRKYMMFQYSVVWSGWLFVILLHQPKSRNLYWYISWLTVMGFLICLKETHTVFKIMDIIKRLTG